jgi:hypothetical protein
MLSRPSLLKRSTNGMIFSTRRYTCSSTAKPWISSDGPPKILSPLGAQARLSELGANREAQKRRKAQNDSLTRVVPG